MAQQLQSWRTLEGSRLWLSMLIDAMEQASRPEIREVPCETLLLEKLRAQLSCPASGRLHGVSPFSLRN